MIEVNGLAYQYPGSSSQVLKGIDFHIAKGEIFGFLGPSGAGKSTTQNILIGALKGYTGSVRVLGLEIRGAGSRYYERIGVAFEFPNFYSRLTAIENLQLFRSLYSGTTEEPMKLLEAVGLSGHAKEKVAGFSKGMRMRLNLCRALLNRPEVLFLDEPTSGLDPVNAKMLKDIIRERSREGTTIVLTTHNMSAAEQLCNRVAFLVDGTIPLIDSPRALMVGLGSRKVVVEYRNQNGSMESAGFELDGIGSDPAFQKLLSSGTVETIHTREATLEQIFIEVTGRGLS
ncbi:ABC transporter ATP-binding protein [Paenibacillus sambharensis]|uniref:ABC transporter ATP-binding protein n=1 Tax=Paenibacillus sambharensis TaxID=1803190 RepID=A0A2W1L973_9BACL|nr:ABC transporter ATP-binding protein [Paenibacillus sambharensis]PZD95463.1 ABC transporter ATP-binding protein [Paenibacillus sambharensis]